MNFRNEALRTMQEIANRHPKYTLGDVVFACFQKLAVKNDTSLSFLREISDEDLYTQVEKAVNLHSEDPLLSERDYLNIVNNFKFE